jgi:hypothetical protein
MMPLDEILRNSAPAIGGLLVAAFALACARFARRSRPPSHTAGDSIHHPAE